MNFAKIKRMLKLKEAKEVLEKHPNVPDGLILDVRTGRVFLAEDENGEIIVVMRTAAALDSLRRYGVITGGGN